MIFSAVLTICSYRSSSSSVKMKGSGCVHQGSKTLRFSESLQRCAAERSLRGPPDSTIIVFTVSTWRDRLLPLHQSASCSISSLYADSSLLLMRLATVVSSANFVVRFELRFAAQSRVRIINSSRFSTRPSGIIGIHCGGVGRGVTEWLRIWIFCPEIGSVCFITSYRIIQNWADKVTFFPICSCLFTPIVASNICSWLFLMWCFAFRDTFLFSMVINLSCSLHFGSLQYLHTPLASLSSQVFLPADLQLSG